MGSASTVCSFVEEISVQNSENSKTATTSTEPVCKKPYAPPKLTSIKLRPEEAVLGTCKNLGAGPSTSPCRLCGANLPS
jgi:hypothetical protein